MPFTRFQSLMALVILTTIKINAMTNISIYKKINYYEKFIFDAKNIHGEKFDYSLVNYVNAHTKIKIICPTHGVFEQTPNNHLSGNGCPKCKGDKQRILKQSNKVEFVTKADKIHGENYDYSLVEYIKSSIKVKIICPTHGEFEQIPYSHLSGKGCPKCKGDKSRILNQSNTEEFLTKANLIHGAKFDYSLVDYKNARIKVKIICPIHGVFEQTPNNHLSRRGCPKCKGDKQRILNTQKWCENYDTGTLYLLRCFNDIEEFLKIGVTSRNINERYSNKILMPYDYEILYEFNGDSIIVSDLEQYIKSNFIYYKPNIYFGGATTETLHISQQNLILEYIKRNSTSKNIDITLIFIYKRLMNVSLYKDVVLSLTSS